MSILDNYYWEWKSIRDKIAELEEENQNLKDENVRLVKNLAEYKNEITDLKEENKKLKEEIENMEKAEKDFMDIMKKYILNKWNIIKMETLYDICFEWK